MKKVAILLTMVILLQTHEVMGGWSFSDLWKKDEPASQELLDAMESTPSTTEDYSLYEKCRELLKESNKEIEMPTEEEAAAVDLRAYELAMKQNNERLFHIALNPENIKTVLPEQLNNVPPECIAQVGTPWGMVFVPYEQREQYGEAITELLLYIQNIMVTNTNTMIKEDHYCVTYACVSDGKNKLMLVFPKELAGFRGSYPGIILTFDDLGIKITETQDSVKIEF
ncbi:MAG: hypothetical protein Q4D38_00260 [Planctomycetia bacterium]|nr:hypothetical protein [Planctomycetia bacterium]